MYIKSLKLQNFRNYADESFAFDPAVNLICGENGQGKTNLLEAAAACSTMRLFRTAQKKEGLRFGENHAFIFADFVAQERDISLELRFSRTKAMEIYKNGVRQKRQSDAQGLLKTVLFCPEDLMLVRAGAAARRRFLDTALCRCGPTTHAISRNTTVCTSIKRAFCATAKKSLPCSLCGGFLAAHGAYRRADYPLPRVLLP